jgi:pimeloyl-ACP methyl ester carboxylesterase
MTGGPTRRNVLTAALSLPLLASCDRGGSDLTTPAGVGLERGTLTSTHWRGHQVGWMLARPSARAGAGTAQAHPPVVVVLHGRGGDASAAFDQLHLERHVASTGLAVASVDGGDFYWHARRSGVDTGAMVVSDFLPLLARRGLDTSRIGLLGWSMGGYGALLLATRLGRRRVGGVVAESAALWQSPGDSAPGAFDDRQDFVAHDVFRARSALAGIPVRLDCGTDDPFLAADRAFVRGLPGVQATFDAGGHTEDYWQSHAGAQLAWLAGHLRPAGQ